MLITNAPIPLWTPIWHGHFPAEDRAYAFAPAITPRQRRDRRFLATDHDPQVAPLL